MPLYEFACDGCQMRFERLMSFSQTSTAVTCPDCGADHVRRVPSVFASLSRGEGTLPMAVGGSCACSSGGRCGCAN